MVRGVSETSMAPLFMDIYVRLYHFHTAWATGRNEQYSDFKKFRKKAVRSASDIQNFLKRRGIFVIFLDNSLLD